MSIWSAPPSSAARPPIGKALHSADADGVFFTYVTVCIAVSLAVYMWAFSNKGPTQLDRQEGHAFEPVEPPAPVQAPVQERHREPGVLTAPRHTGIPGEHHARWLEPLSRCRSLTCSG